MNEAPPTADAEHHQLLADLVDRPGAYLEHDDAGIRRLAASACAAHVAEHLAGIAALVDDPDALVRAEAVEILGGAGAAALPELERARSDSDPRVLEALATAYGEIGDRAVIEWLEEQGLTSEDRTVREAAVAALGAIGDPESVGSLLEALSGGPPQVRRRAVAALTVFDDPRVEAALRAASGDRNPMVREAIEMVVGRTIPKT